MNTQERDALAAICLLAAFADGAKSEREREQIRSMMSSYGAESLENVYQRVASGQITAESAAGQLGTPEARRQAYEMAVVVCDSDEARSEAEKAFLTRLHGALGLPAADRSLEQQADSMVDFGLGNTAAPVLAPAAAAALPVPAAGSGPHAARDSEIDSSILKYSILNAALELLPQHFATAAIIPLQMRMVYGIGKSHGYTLDKGHIKDFLATVGIGATSQVLENYTRKLLGGLAARSGGLLGGVLKTVLGTGAEHATGPIFSFATTYALGHVAKQYYAQGRTLKGDALRAAFTTHAQSAQGLYQKCRTQIEAQAKNLNVHNLVSLVRGS